MKYSIRNLRDSKYYNLIDWMIFALALGASAIVMAYLFYHQATSDGQTFLSDMGPYIDEVRGTQEKFDFPYPVLFKTTGLIDLVIGNTQIAMVIAIVFFNILAIVITKGFLNRTTGVRLLSSGVTICLFFLSMLYSLDLKVLGINYRYAGTLSPNPWHNATYMAARPFMILAFIYGVKLLSGYEDGKVKRSDYIIFAIVMLLSTMAKPSYTIVHMGAFGLATIYRLVKAKGATFKSTLVLACAYIPTIVDLLYQYSGVFSGTATTGEEKGIGISLFRVWSIYSDNIPLSIFLAGAFPICVLAFNFKILKTNAYYRFAWQVYATGLVMYALLYEKGPRDAHGNFGWGYICGLFIVFMVSIMVLLKNTLRKIAREEVLRIKGLIIIALQWILLIIHTLMGLHYFQLLCWGGNYM